MTTLRKPTMRVFIQAKQAFHQGSQNALVFEAPPFFIEGRISYALAEGAAGLGTCDLELYNVSDDLMGKLEPSGIILVEAGYLDEEEVKPAPIFYGLINYAFPVRKGAERVWSVHATTMSPRYNIFVPYEGHNVIIGDVIKTLAASIGAEIRLPKIAFDRSVALLSKYTTTESVQKEIEYLIALLSKATGRTYLMAPGVEKPHIRHVVTASSEEDAMLLTIDESAQSVYSSGITPMQGEPEKMLVPKALGTGSQLAIEIDGEVSMFEYNMSMAFDPRVTPGMWVHSVGANGKSGAAARSLGAGSLFFTKSVQHIIGGDEWVTQINGPILDSDLISVRRKVA